jgi:hypothetical protein
MSRSTILRGERVVLQGRALEGEEARERPARLGHFPKNFVRLFQPGWPVTYQAVWSPATTHARPRVRGTKKK